MRSTSGASVDGMAKQSGRLLNLDLLRLVSALMVLSFHYGFRMRISGEGGGLGFAELAPFAIWGDIGLLIFFSISGYVITLSAEGRSAYAFASGRVARLWPTFVVRAGLLAAGRRLRAGEGRRVCGRRVRALAIPRPPSPSG